MKLENQVCSLELAKQLKTLGVNQESLFWWNIVDEKLYFTDIMMSISDRVPETDVCWYGNFISAFTVAELGEMLPSRVEWKGHNYMLHCEKANDHMWATKYLNWGRPMDENVWVMPGWTIEKGDANARAKMLIYLLENKLIEI